MSSSAWIFAALAVVLAVAFGGSLYWAGRRGADGAPRSRALWLALLAPLAVAALYAARGTPQALNLPPAHGAPGTVDPNVMVQRLAEHLKEHPEDLDGWLMLGRSYMVLGRYPEAEAAYERAQTKVVQDSDLLVTWIELRIMLAGRKFDARALELLDQAVKLAPDNADVMLLRALAAFDRGDKTESDALVSKLHERFPPGTPDRENLDAALKQWMARNTAKPEILQPPVPPASAASMPDLDTMVQRLANRLKDHPEDLDGWLMLARSYAALGRYADADAAYQHAQARAMQDSAQLAVWVEMRLRLNGLKFDQRARELLDQATKLAPDNADVMLLGALAAFDRGDKAGGDALVSKLHDRFPLGTPERQSLDAAIQQLRPR